ncbi:MAG TPA: hypothetical protein VM639_08550, partial [Dongiaceae bacterium]|nr:hypothetical protein [Dongiaceae bacterium]
DDVDFERDLSDAFAPVKMPLELQRKLLQVPQLHPQRPASWLVRLMPRPWFDGMMAVSLRPAFGMTTSVAAACFSLVIGLSLGLGGVLPQTQAIQSVAEATSQSGTTGNATGDNVSLLYAAADLPGDLP